VAGVVPFIVPDAVKAAVAVGVVPAVRRAPACDRRASVGQAGESHREDRAALLPVRRLDGPPVRRHDRPDDRETQAAPPWPVARV